MRLLPITAILLLGLARLGAADLSPAESELKEQLGPGTPDPVQLWDGDPPGFLAEARPEVLAENQRIRNVSVPTVSPYLPAPETATGMALVVCAGGGYGGHDWKMHDANAAEVFLPLGVAVVGLKYRTRPPHIVPNEEIQALTLLDAKRAVRLVRHRAAEWNLDPALVGIVGYSAGANLAMNLAANFDEGDSGSSDPIERLSGHPAFAVGLGTWHWRKPENPFVFRAESPPVYLVHATTDKPVEIAENIVADLKSIGVPARLDLFEEGAHGVGNLVPQRVKNGFPPARWPWLVLDWLDEIEVAPR